MIKALVALTAFAIPFAVIAQTANNVPWEGTWKENVAKSTYQPGPPPKSATVTIASDGKVTYEDVGGDGQSSHWFVTPEQGKAVPVNGVQDLTVTRESQTGNTYTDTWKGPSGTTRTGKGVLSKDGKTLTYTMQGTNPKGQRVDHILIFEKQ